MGHCTHYKFDPAILSLSIFAVFRAWVVSVEERRKLIPADILAKHTPEPGRSGIVLRTIIGPELSLFKAVYQSIKGLVSLAKQHEDHERMRAVVFLFEPIYEAYQQHLVLEHMNSSERLSAGLKALPDKISSFASTQAA